MVEGTDDPIRPGRFLIYGALLGVVFLLLLAMAAVRLLGLSV